jgi:hypothetical protein
VVTCTYTNVANLDIQNWIPEPSIQVRSSNQFDGITSSNSKMVELLLNKCIKQTITSPSAGSYQLQYTYSTSANLDPSISSFSVWVDNASISLNILTQAGLNTRSNTINVLENINQI